MTDRESLVDFRERTVEERGGVDVLLASPIAIACEPIASVSEGDWGHVLNVQLTGVHRRCQVFQSVMDSGSIVTVSSVGRRSRCPRRRRTPQ